MSEQSAERAYQVVMDGVKTFSAPYTDKSEAEDRAEELTEEVEGETFSVEEWPNHRQEDEK